MSPEIQPVNSVLGPAEIIEIAGPDALAFAHAQFTSDVAGLAAGTWQYSAWLSAQGRARCVFVLLRTDADRLVLWLPLGGARALRDALARFVFRAKVKIEVAEGWQLGRVDGAADDFQTRQVVSQGGGYAFTQPGPHTRMGWLGAATAPAIDPTALHDWRLDDIAARLPWLDPSLQDEFVPQALDLERIDAIRFDKGCYPGQEIAARLHFRGGSKRSLHRVRLTGALAVPPGLRVQNGTAEAGVVLYGASMPDGSHEALAVLLDASTESESLLTTSGHVVEIIT